MIIEHDGPEGETASDYIERRARVAQEKGMPNPWVREQPYPSFVASGLSILGRALQGHAQIWPHVS